MTGEQSLPLDRAKARLLVRAIESEVSSKRTHLQIAIRRSWPGTVTRLRSELAELDRLLEQVRPIAGMKEDSR